MIWHRETLKKRQVKSIHYNAMATHPRSSAGQYIRLFVLVQRDADSANTMCCIR